MPAHDLGQANFTNCTGALVTTSARLVADLPILLPTAQPFELIGQWSSETAQAIHVPTWCFLAQAPNTKKKIPRWHANLLKWSKHSEWS